MARRVAGRPQPREDAQPRQGAWPGDADAEAEDSWPDDSESPAAAGAAKTARQRRRVGFRKGAEVDEELWPAESFGGVSDEQFWDDLASDKPLTTTARTAQQDPGTRKRPLDTGPATDPQAVQALGDDRKRDSLAREDQGRGEGRRGEGRRGAGTGAYPRPRTGPNPATERTAIQPAYAATQPVPSMTRPVPSTTSQLPGVTQAVRVAGSSSQPNPAIQPRAASQPSPAIQPRAASQPSPAIQPRAASQPSPAIQPRAASQPNPVSQPNPAGQPRGAAPQPSQTRRRRPSSAEEDPLTSAAFSLRSSGPVDGRSTLRPRDTAREQYDPAGGSGRGSASSHGSTSQYSYPTPSYGDPASVTQTMSTPPYGENYGYGNGTPAAQADEPRRQNGTRSHARPEGTGEGTRPARQAYPREGHQATGSYQGSGSHQGNGYPGQGHRAPYDPRDDYRRLTHQH